MKKALILFLVIIAAACGDQDLRPAPGAETITENFKDSDANGRLLTCSGQADYTWLFERPHLNYPTYNPSQYSIRVYANSQPSANGCVGISGPWALQPYSGTYSYNAIIEFTLTNWNASGGTSATFNYAIKISRSHTLTGTLAPGQTTKFRASIPSGATNTNGLATTSAIPYTLTPTCPGVPANKINHRVSWEFVSVYTPQIYPMLPTVPTPTPGNYIGAIVSYTCP